MGEVPPGYGVLEVSLWAVCVSDLGSCSSDRLTPVFGALIMRVAAAAQWTGIAEEGRLGS